MKTRDAAINLSKRVTRSVNEMNEKILATHAGILTTDQLGVAAQLEQVSLMHELLLGLAVLLLPEPEEGASNPPDLGPGVKMIGFRVDEKDVVNKA